MADNYMFQYLPLTGKLPGRSMLEQTERAINELGNLVYARTVDPSYIEGLAVQANENSEEAIEIANQALSTTGRVYVTVTEAVDANDYYDSELIYIANSASTNIPEESTGFLTVKTNYAKTATAQTFMSDESGKIYVRYAVITASEVGSTTVYTATWGSWSTQVLFSGDDAVLSSLETNGDANIGGELIIGGSTNVGQEIAKLNSYPHFEYVDDELYLVYGEQS